MLLSLIALNMVISDYKTVQAVFQTGMNPGMAVRLEQDTVNAMKVAMQEFLPNFVEHDMKLPSEYHYAFGPKWFEWVFDYSQIAYTDANFDIKDIVMVMIRQYDQPMLKVDFPSFKEWKITAL
jgi:hypothetical protein